MGRYELTLEADRRLVEIYRHSVERFGLKAGRRYLTALHEALELLGDRPMLGSDCGWIRPNCRRLARRSHVVYYEPREGGILVLTVLHQSEDPGRALFEDG